MKTNPKEEQKEETLKIITKIDKFEEGKKVSEIQLVLRKGQ